MTLSLGAPCSKMVTVLLFLMQSSLMQLKPGNFLQLQRNCFFETRTVSKTVKGFSFDFTMVVVLISILVYSLILKPGRFLRSFLAPGKVLYGFYY